MSSENLLDKNRKEWLMRLAEKEAERTSAELEQIWQEEKRKLAEKCPYSNEKEREFFGYKEEEERQAEHDKEYPIKIIFTYKPALEYKTKQEAIESLKVRFKMSQIYDIYVPIYDEIYDPVYSFTRREAYTFIKALQKDKTLKKYELIEESREMFRKDLIKYNENHGIRGEVDWKKYESQLMVSK